MIFFKNVGNQTDNGPIDFQFVNYPLNFLDISSHLWPWKALSLLITGAFIKKSQIWPCWLKAWQFSHDVAVTKRAHTNTNQWCLFCSHNAYTICSRHPNKQFNLITQWTQHTVAKNTFTSGNQEKKVNIHECWTWLRDELVLHKQLAATSVDSPLFRSTIFRCVFCD